MRKAKRSNFMIPIQKRFSWTAAAIAGVLLCGTARADETPFGYIYTTDSLPKGKWEYEQWNTVRTGKPQGTYASLDNLNEAEYGFTDSFSGAFYLHSSLLHTHNALNPDDTTENLDNQTNFDVNGVSLELKKRLLSPYKDPIGLTVYMEPELGLRSSLTGEDVTERAVEFKLIMDRHFLDDKLILAANFVFEPEWERDGDERDKELKNEYSVGAAYGIAPGWFGGLEFLNRRKFARQSFGRQDASAWFLGPSVHYANKAWWTTLTALPQISGNPRTLGLDANGNDVSDGSRTLGEYEKLEIRLRVGFNF
jgi:hypothetical protein